MQFETIESAIGFMASRQKPARKEPKKRRLWNPCGKIPQRRALAGVPPRRNTFSRAAIRAFRICGGAMTREEERELTLELERLKQEHRDLDSAIDALLSTSGHDRIQVQRLKKRKLQLRDRMYAIEDQLFPDIIA